ncbi:AAA family ATPase, partial [Mammaliicoccus vitulinus]|uniref:AAA family ATPase n=1 Tax=Mammaliicoccus vitulinus TaxID=71237 RepID=UPI001158CDB6
MLTINNINMNFQESKQYIEDIKSSVDLWKKVHTLSSQTIEYLETEIKTLEFKLKKEQNAIEGINNWIQYFFNRDDLKMELDEIDGRVFFKVMRNNKIAFNLSEGERRILSFCYFLTILKDQINLPKSKSEYIIYIDDPISSLDQKHIFSIFSSINSYILKSDIHQLFISTHSLEFLKYLNRLDIDKKEIGHYLIEKSKSEKDSKYKSSFKVMPSTLKEFNTEYQYLFNRIFIWNKHIKQKTEETMNKRIENAFTDFYDLPNILRRFLEIHLFYV